MPRRSAENVLTPRGTPHVRSDRPLVPSVIRTLYLIISKLQSHCSIKRVVRQLIVKTVSGIFCPFSVVYLAENGHDWLGW